jgi:hypothetical protein
MKAAVVKSLCELHDAATLERAAESVTEDGVDPLQVEGDDLGEQLTHLMLAARIRRRVEAGEDLKVAFRTEMAQVRTVLTNRQS